jgi:two-component system, response regulator YesN
VTVLIVDDEASVRAGLATIIDWPAHGFTACAEAADGPEALRAILERRPELTLLDVRMPGMSGIAVASAARAAGHAGAFIILSGHSEFAYAQEAIRSGVAAYLLKPIDERELSAAVTATARALGAERARRAATDEARRLARREALRGLLLGRGGEAAEEPAPVDLPPGAVRVAVVEPGDGSADGFLRPLLRRYASAGFLEEVDDGAAPVVLVLGKDGLARFERALGRGARVLRAAGAYVGIGRPAGCAQEARASHQDALGLVDRRFFSPEEQIFGRRGPGESPDAEPPAAPTMEEYAERLYRCIELGRSAGLDRLLEEVGRRWRARAGAGRHAAIGALAGLASGVWARVLGDHPAAVARPPTWEQIVERLSGEQRLDGALRRLRGELASAAAASGAPGGHGAAARLREYVVAHSAEALRLKDLAAAFGYNSAYLGRLFRRETGEGFGAYVAGARIRAAASLLGATELKVYEVARKAGYGSLLRFNREFKKRTGSSPSEYRRSARGGGTPA